MIIADGYHHPARGASRVCALSLCVRRSYSPFWQIYRTQAVAKDKRQWVARLHLSALPSLTQRLVARLLDNFQVANLNPRDGKVRNLKFNIDGCSPIQQVFYPCKKEQSSAGTSSRFRFQRTILDTRQTKVRSHEILSSPAKLLDLPDHCRLLWSVVYRASSRPKLW